VADIERRRWLETLAAACEAVLGGDRKASSDPLDAALLDDAASLLARIRISLGAANG
jgi:hypothetical protein